MNNITEWLSFDDVMLLPNYSEIFKEDIDLSAFLSQKISLKIPLVSSPMDTVTEWKMAVGLAELGGIGIIHRNLSIVHQVDQVCKVKKLPGNLLVGAAVGVGKDMFPRVEALVKAGVL